MNANAHAKLAGLFIRTSVTKKTLAHRLNTKLLFNTCLQLYFDVTAMSDYDAHRRPLRPDMHLHAAHLDQGSQAELLQHIKGWYSTQCWCTPVFPEEARSASFQYNVSFLPSFPK